MNSLKKDTYNRPDLEASLRKEFPSLTKSQISEAIDCDRPVNASIFN